MFNANSDGRFAAHASASGLHTRSPFVSERDTLLNKQVQEGPSDSIDRAMPQAKPDVYASMRSYEPVARRVWASFILETKRGVELSSAALYGRISKSLTADQLSHCIDGKKPFAVIGFGDGFEAHLAVYDDPQNGLIKFDFYKPADSTSKKLPNEYDITAKSEIDTCIKVIAEHLYDRYSLKRAHPGLRHPHEIIKLEHYNADME